VGSWRHRQDAVDRSLDTPEGSVSLSQLGIEGNPDGKLSFDDLRLLLKCSIRQTMTAKKRELRAIGAGARRPIGGLS
jgi:hypothetical protein